MLTDEEFTGFLKISGRRTRAIRKTKNLNLRHIVISTGYYDALWRKYELGGSMNISTLMKIALALDVPLSELLGELGQGPLRSVAEITQAEQTTDAVLDSSET